MQRGIIFIVEAIYILAIVFATLFLFVSSLETIDPPNYDIIQTMKVAHDYGENHSIEVVFPAGYLKGPCPDQTSANLSYYNVEVCFE